MKLEKTYNLPFPAEQVFHAWVSSNTVIPPATSMDIDPKAGGHYRLIMETPEFTGRNEGEFIRVEPPCRVTYTWEWNGDGEVTTIDVRFTPDNGGTRVTLTHDGFTSEDSVANHDGGWDSYIEGFTAHLKEN